MRINLIGILNILSVLLFINAALMALCIPFAIYYKDGTFDNWLYSVLISAVLGGILQLATRKNERSRDIKKRDGYIIVTFSWIVMALSGSVPFILTGSIPSFTNAFFESIFCAVC